LPWTTPYLGPHIYDTERIVKIMAKDGTLMGGLRRSSWVVNVARFAIVQLALRPEEPPEWAITASAKHRPSLAISSLPAVACGGALFEWIVNVAVPPLVALHTMLSITAASVVLRET